MPVNFQRQHCVDFEKASASHLPLFRPTCHFRFLPCLVTNNNELIERLCAACELLFVLELRELMGKKTKYQAAGFGQAPQGMPSYDPTYWQRVSSQNQYYAQGQQQSQQAYGQQPQKPFSTTSGYPHFGVVQPIPYYSAQGRPTYHPPSSSAQMPLSSSTPQVYPLTQQAYPPAPSSYAASPLTTSTSAAAPRSSSVGSCPKPWADRRTWPCSAAAAT